MTKDDTLADEIITNQLSLFRYTAGERLAILAILRNMEEELIDRLFGGGRPLTDIGRDDRARLLRQVQKVIDDYYRQISSRSDEQLQELARVEAVGAAAALETAFRSAITPSLPTDAVLRQLAKKTAVFGAPSADWWARQAGDLKFRFAAAVNQGLAQAEANDAIIRRIRGKYIGYTVVDGQRISNFAGGILDATRAQVAAQVQTSVQAVANAARRETMLANDDVVKGVRQVSTLDGHTTPVCIAYSQAAWSTPRDGRGWAPIAPNKLPYNGGVPRHWNCLPADSLVTTRGDVTGVSKRWFDGEVFVVRMASGRELTCTPNHPVLTPGGWVAARLLNVGGHVVADGGSEWGTVGDRNSEDVPTAIHQVTESWLRARQVVAVPVPLAAEDFHGDGVGSKIAVVYSDRLLRDGGDTPRAQHSVELGLVAGLAARAVGLVRGCHGEQSVGAGRASAHCSIGGGGQALAFFRRGVRHARRLLFAAVSGRNASIPQHPFDERVGATEAIGNTFDADAGREQLQYVGQRDIGPHARIALDARGVEPAVDRCQSDLEHARELLGGFTGRVFADEIVDIQVDAFHGFVFNLETVGGWYTANGILTHNCRSVEIPITKTFKELGIDLPEFDPSSTTRSATTGPVAADMSFAAFLQRQEKKGPAFVDDLLGPGRAQLWREKKITLRDLVDGQGRELSLKELRKRYG